MSTRGRPKLENKRVTISAKVDPKTREKMERVRKEKNVSFGKQIDKGLMMDVIVTKNYIGEFVAIDRDTYDGCIDGNNFTGTGATPKEAKLELVETLIDNGFTVRCWEGGTKETCDCPRCGISRLFG